MIRINLVGRLGNDLYQYSACRTIAENIGCNYYVDCSGINQNYHFGGDGKEHNIVKLFNVDVGQIDSNIKYYFYESLRDRTVLTGPTQIDMDSISYLFNTDGFKETITDVLSKIEDNTLLNGFFPNSFYFEKNIDNLRNWFPFKVEDYSILSEYDPEEYCFIHYRGGDFVCFKGREQFLTEIYYKNAVRFFPNKKYVIVTNDLELATEYFKWMEEEGLEFKILKSEDSLEHLNRDFFTLTRVKYFIGTYSSFSEWSGYLNVNRDNGLFLFPFCVTEDETSVFRKGLYKYKYFTYLTKKDII